MKLIGNAIGIVFILSINQGVLSQSGKQIPEERQKYPDIKIKGMVQPVWNYDFRAGQLPNNEFVLKRTRAGVEVNITKYLNAEIEVDLTDSELIKDAKFDFEINRFVKLSAGKRKIPFSRERLTSVKKLIFVDRSKIVKEIEDIGYAGRDIGANLDWLFYTSRTLEVEFSAGVYNGTAGSLEGDLNNSKNFAQRLEINYQKDFSIGLNSSQRLDSITAKYFVANGVDFFVKPIKQLYIDGEALIGKRQNGKLTGGGYLTAEYEIGDFLIGFRFEKYFKDINTNIESRDVITSKFEWSPNKYMRFQINYINTKEFGLQSNSELLLSTQVSF
jgi:hypothetical protein